MLLFQLSANKEIINHKDLQDPSCKFKQKKLGKKRFLVIKYLIDINTKIQEWKIFKTEYI